MAVDSQLTHLKLALTQFSTLARSRDVSKYKYVTRMCQQSIRKKKWPDWPIELKLDGFDTKQGHYVDMIRRLLKKLNLIQNQTCNSKLTDPLTKK